MAVPKDPREIETADPFRALFPIDPTVRDLVGSSIRENGFDPSKPLLCWRDAYGERGRTICVDGHTRLSLAIEFGLNSVPVTMRRFDSVDAAIAAAIGEQAQRRNLNPSQLAIHVLTMLDRFDDDGFHGQGARNDLYGRSAKDLAEMVGVTSRTIERARQLIAFGDDALIAQVRAGEIGLKTAVEAGQRADAAHSRATTTSRNTVPRPEPELETCYVCGETPALPDKGFCEACGRIPAGEIREVDALLPLPHLKAKWAPEPTPAPEPEPEAQPAPARSRSEPRKPKASERGGLDRYADVLWGAFEVLRDFEDLPEPSKDAWAQRIADSLIDILNYFGIEPDQDDATVQEWIVEAAWDDNVPPRPAPWEEAA